jgi:alpha-tubulin suppressor-like RCC1 family protein
LDKNHQIYKSGGTINTSGWNNIIKIYGSSSYLLGLDMDGKTYLSDMYNNQIIIWEGIKILDISCSSTHCLGIDENLTVKTYNLSSTTIDTWENIVEISAGNNWSVAVDNTRKIYIDGIVPPNVEVSNTLFYNKPLATNTSLLSIL